MTIEVSDIQLAALVRGDAVTVGPSKRVITLDDGPFVVNRHHGPGPHSGTGTPQDVHGGNGVKIDFTKPQQDWVDWALDGMDDEEMYPEGPPTFEQALADPETVTDLLYRLEVLAGDMAADGYLESGVGALGAGRAAANAAAKIRKAIEPDITSRHHGPGPHSGTGTPQEIHGGGKERPLETGVFNPDDIERVQPIRGFCFERSAEWLILEQGNKYEQARLIHGTVMGQGPLEGVRFAHAWVEIDDWVYDVSQDILSPKDNYYQLAEAEDMVSYTGTEAAVNSLKEKNWGPWEENLINLKEEELKKWITGQ